MKSGAVLAGGKSKRFGQDKRFFKLGEKTLLEIACDKIRRNFEKRYVSVDKNFVPPYFLSDFVIVRDKIEDIGPLGGIYSVLSEIDDIGCVFIPVDMPYLPDDILKYIGSLYRYDAVYIRIGEKIYPIPSYFSKNTLSVLEKSIREGKFSLKNLVDLIDNKFEISDVRSFGDPSKILININRPDDHFL